MSVYFFVCFLSFGISCILPICFGLLFSSLFLIKFLWFYLSKKKSYYGSSVKADVRYLQVCYHQTRIRVLMTQKNINGYKTRLTVK